MLVIYFYLLLVSNVYGENSGDLDEVHSLPGLETKPTFKHYSGYLNATNERYLHYWFVESESNPAHDPVILWLTGGPGCSSIVDGMFGEIGPWRVNADSKTLRTVNNNWNTIANVLFIESPAEVGYSYQTNHSVKTDDDETAEDNYLALQHFFKKFPQFSKSNFYITGESYAGVYIPTLALNILSSNSSINLKGIAIGNGQLDYNLLLNSKIEYAYSHGLIDPQMYHSAEEHCCKCNDNKRVCDFSKGLQWDNINPIDPNDKCTKAAAAIHTEVQSLGINRYNIYYNNKEIDEFISSTIIAKYLDLPEVRKSLHIHDDLKSNKMDCNLNVILNYENKYRSMKVHIQQLLAHKLNPIIIYNGDADIVCDFLGDYKFLESLGLSVDKQYKSWHYNGQTAGFVKRYSQGLVYLTIKGAGHFVPTDKPNLMLKIIHELIGNSKIN